MPRLSVIPGCDSKSVVEWTTVQKMDFLIMNLGCEIIMNHSKELNDRGPVLEIAVGHWLFSDQLSPFG